MLKILMNKESDGGGGDGGTGSDVAELDNDNTAGAEGGEEGAGSEDGEDEMEYYDDDAGDGAGAEGDKGAGKDKKGPAGAESKAATDYARYKELLGDDEDFDDEKVFTKVKGLKDENQNLRVLAMGREAIDKDKDINTYRNLLSASNDNLAYLTLVQDYVDSDIPEAAAKEKATAEIAKIKAKEDGDEQIEKIALGTKRLLKSNIKEREGEILQQVKTAQKSIDLRPSDNKVIEKSKSEVATLDSFIGFRLPKDHKAKIVKTAQDYIGSEQERKDLNDPKIRGKIAMFLAHERQWTKNVEARSGNTKSAVIKKAQSQPKVTKGKAAVKPVVRGKDQGSGRVMKNPAAFLGGK